METLRYHSSEVQNALKTTDKAKTVSVEQMRRAVADYMYSEGCSCCRDEEAHTEHKRALAELLDVPAHADGSGYNFYQFRTR